MGKVAAQTVVSPLEQNCESSTDVIFYKDRIDGSAGGHSPCIRTNANGYCDTRAVTIDWDLIQAVSTHPNYQARKTICHEIGHTLGVRHYSAGSSPDGTTNSCMISGVYDSGADWTKQYGPHHVAHINSWF